MVDAYLINAVIWFIPYMVPCIKLCLVIININITMDERIVELNLIISCVLKLWLALQDTSINARGHNPNSKFLYCIVIYKFICCSHTTVQYIRVEQNSIVHNTNVFLL